MSPIVSAIAFLKAKIFYFKATRTKRGNNNERKTWTIPRKFLRFTITITNDYPTCTIKLSIAAARCFIYSEK